MLLFTVVLLHVYVQALFIAASVLPIDTSTSLLLPQNGCLAMNNKCTQSVYAAYTPHVLADTFTKSSAPIMGMAQESTITKTLPNWPTSEYIPNKKPALPSQRHENFQPTVFQYLLIPHINLYTIIKKIKLHLAQYSMYRHDFHTALLGLLQGRKNGSCEVEIFILFGC